MVFTINKAILDKIKKKIKNALQIFLFIVKIIINYPYTDRLNAMILQNLFSITNSELNYFWQYVHISYLLYTKDSYNNA